MSTSAILTVGIPTYNRCDAVVERVRELLDSCDELGVRILVIDNASSDETAEKLEAEFAGAGVDIRRNDANLGYAGNLLRLIEVTETEYLTVVSDEDLVERSGLVALLAVLRERRPRLVSPRAQVGDNDCYRGRRSTRPIGAEEFESAAFYVSGVTFEVAGARRDAATLGALIPANAAATYYPQVLLTALAVLDGESLFLDALVTRQVVKLQTRISDPGRGAYWFVPGRWAQFEGFEEFFQATIERLPDSGAEVGRMRESMRSGMFRRLETAAVAQFPELAGHVHPPRESLLGGFVRVLRLGGMIRALRRG